MAENKLYYVWNESSHREYWCIAADPKDGIREIVRLYNQNCFPSDSEYTVEEFIREYPDGTVSEITCGKAYDDDYNTPSQKENTYSWEEIWND